MKLFASFSEAIREGAKLRPQQFYAPKANDKGSCAVSAGFEAITGERGGDLLNYVFLEDTYPYLKRGIKCPECQSYEARTTDALWHLNDSHRWTREAIADWLETEEEKLGFVTLIEPETQRTATVSALSKPDTVVSSLLH